jgi:transcriptional regulator with XRE-family HTH domain
MAKSTAQKFGENMKKIRTEKGMSQGDICRELGLDRAYISNVENGKQNLTINTMEKVAKVLGVSVDQLLK